LDINVNLSSFLVQSTQGIVLNMGHVSKSESIEIQNWRVSPFNNMDLVWKKNVWHGGAHIIEIESAYIPHAWVLEFLNNEQNHEDSWMEWNIYKHVSPQENVKMQKIPKPLQPYLVWCCIVHFCYIDFFLNLILYKIIGLKLIAYFVGMHVGMDQKIIVKTQTTINSLNEVV